MFGSIRLSLCLFVHTLTSEPFDLHVAVDIWAQLAEYSKSTMTHGMQSKISVCLSVIRKCLRSRAAHSGRGLLI